MFENVYIGSNSCIGPNIIWKQSHNKFKSTITENINSKSSTFDETQRVNSISDYIELKNKWILET